MPGCCLTAIGSNFDVDAFMSHSAWRDFASIHHRGEATHLITQPVQQHSGLSFGISDLDEDELEPQVRDAMEFLRRERDEIQRLAAFPGVELLEFRMGLFWRRDTLCQFHTLPGEFLRLAGEVGVAVTLSIYAVSEDEAEAEPGASPNGGPAECVGNSEAGGGPPSVS
jgi:hypothetical protein